MSKTITAQDLEAAAARRADLVAKSDAISRRNGTFDPVDPGMLSGTRRKPNARADAQRFAAYSREAEAWREADRAERDLRSLKAQFATQTRNTPIPFTEEQYKAAGAVRTKLGWHKVVRVNAKSVTVETGYSWTDRIDRAKIIEVR